MSQRRYYLLSVASGIGWGGAALCIALLYDIDTPWGGIIASPLIGLLIGHLSRRTYHRAMPVRVVLAIGMLYLATGLFGLAEGAWRLAVGHPIDEPVWAYFGSFALMFPGIVTFLPPLWPLFGAAVLNHWWLGLQDFDENRQRTVVA